MKKNELKTEFLLFGLVVLTVIAVIFREAILGTVLVIDPRGDYNHTFSNGVLLGGNTTSEWLSEDQSRWRCSLDKGDYAYPFCGHEIYLNNSFKQGIDLSGFRTIKIWLKYQGPGRTIRIFLRTYSDAYSNENDLKSTKFNALEFEKNLISDGVLEVNLADFSVADWWLLERRIPFKHSYTDFSNVVIFEIQTGSGSFAGEHVFELDRVEFRRQLIPAETWYLAIIVTWIAVILIFLFYRISLLKREISKKNDKNKKLQELYDILDKRANEMELRSKTDPLTGVFNRKGVEDSLKAALDDWHNFGSRLSIVFLDIDHFKEINDTFGHSVGDEVLIKLSALVNDNIRAEDWFARWGGEEFLLVCRNAELIEAVGIAEKLRGLIEMQDIRAKLSVTASFGVASIQKGESLKDLFRRADEALYQAKQMGRNTVVSSSA